MLNFRNILGIPEGNIPAFIEVIFKIEERC